MKTENRKSIEHWRDLVRRGREHPSGISSFCESEGIPKSGYYYWRAKLNRKRQVATNSSFAKIEVVQPMSRTLPDPRWMAEFLMALESAR